MATLTGAPVVDASGNQIIDASANEVGEPDIPVVIRNGVLTDARDPGGGFLGIDWGQLVEDVSDVLQTLQELIDGTLTMQAVRNLQNDVNGYLKSDGTDFFSGHDPVYPQTNYSINGLLAEIPEPEGGGLTTEEHNALLALENVDYSQIAGDVWGFTLAMDDNLSVYWGPQAQTILTSLGYLAQKQGGLVGWPIAGNPWFTFCPVQLEQGVGWLQDWTAQALGAGLPLLDLSLVQEGDTVLSFLEREYPTFDWTLDGPVTLGTTGMVWLVGSENQYYWRCVLTNADMRVQQIPAQVSEIVVDVNVVTAPVWPGVANVTLGTPEALTGQLHITGTMDGVIVNITTPPSHTGLRVIGGANYDYNVGEVAFETDEGDIEPWQYMGFRTAIFTPKTMAHAAGARFRILAGAEGTVTPWTVS